MSDTGTASGSDGALEGVKILVVDDDEDARYVISHTLMSQGFDCVEADDAETAFALLQHAEREQGNHRHRPAVVDRGSRAGGARRRTAVRKVGAAGSGLVEAVASDPPLSTDGLELPSEPVDEGVVAESPGDFSLVIADVRMPGKDGFWLLDELVRAYDDIQIIMLTAVDDSRTAVECLRRGACDYLVKPVDKEELGLSVQLALERRWLKLENKAYQQRLERLVETRTEDVLRTLDRLRRSYTQTLAALAAALDAREQETAHHSERVAEHCSALMRRLGVADESELRAIRYGALLHDIGKIGIPDNILLKPGPLTDEEWKVMREHPAIGHEILQEVEFLQPSLDLVLYHQERYDGSGYPEGRSGDEIPLAARAFAVVDAWDAMTHRRPYGEPMSINEAMEELRRGAGTRFDPEVVDAFLEMVRELEDLGG